MCADTANDHKPNKILSLLSNRCPRCRRGKLYIHANPYKLKTMLLMNDPCPVCGQVTDMEPGFYYGTSYVSYALGVAISVASFIAWWALIGFSLSDNRFFYWMGVNAVLLIVLQPMLMRLARTIWLSFFVSYSPRWKEGDVVKAERVNKSMKNAW
ncbi:MAG: DUF983 domain-containing protein [Chitinophagaceae bacterium]|nr:DUF983 domain-containing protein [Chitinophagaceae bacterium]